MKFQVNTNALKTGLDIVNHATASVSTTPILENILIKANYNNITLTSNNLEMAIEYVIAEDINIDIEWSFSIPSKIFTSFIGLTTDDRISVELLDDDSIEVRTEADNIKIKWIEASEFPLIPTIKEENTFKESSKIIKKSINKTLFSAAEWNIRPTLAWLYVDITPSNITFASTDSFRLTEYKTQVNSSISEWFHQIVPSRTCSELARILSDNEEVKIVTWENQIAFIFGNTKFYSRLLNGKFPDYTSFFPTSYSTKAIINRNDLIQALKKINLISKENNYSIKMSLSSETGILLETSETQIWEWKLVLIWSVEWEDNIVWINSVYFLEVLSVIESTHISISFESPLAPIQINPVDDSTEDKKDSSFKHIIMPLKI